MDDMEGFSYYPLCRPRRLRQFPWIRQLVQENNLCTRDLVWPLFVIDQENGVQPIDKMPNVYRLSRSALLKAVDQAVELGIKVVALFPCIENSKKTKDAEEAYNPDGLIARMVTLLKERYQGDIGIMCDVALDPFTCHGQDGLFNAIGDIVLNDETIETLIKQALVYAHSGCDIIAPSDMMDGRIKLIRQALDEEELHNTIIMSYAAKYASTFYGPFRNAVGSASMVYTTHVDTKHTKHTDYKKTYQMDPANAYESLKEVALDIQEGADMVIVKPAMPYLDILYRVKQKFHIPTFVYQTSGEYALIKAGIGSGIFANAQEAIMEIFLGFKRAGADGVISYFAPEIAKNIKEN